MDDVDQELLIFSDHQRGEYDYNLSSHCLKEEM